MTSSVSDRANDPASSKVEDKVLFCFLMRPSAPLTVLRDPFTDPGQPTATAREFTQQEARGRKSSQDKSVLLRTNRKFRVSAVEMV